MDEELAGEQPQNSNNRVPKQLQKYVFKKGISGNPDGRPKGVKSMKQYAKEYLQSMPEDDRIEFLNSVDPKTIWEMGEDKAGQGVQVTAEITSKIINVDE